MDRSKAHGTLDDLFKEQLKQLTVQLRHIGSRIFPVQLDTNECLI